MITLIILKRVLQYNPINGEFRWKVSLGSRCKLGGIAGTINDKGYRIIFIYHRKYKASRLAWFYMTGIWPKEEIDHKNLIKHDDSWDNLREANSSQNKANVALSIRNTSGIKGVTFYHGKWQASIRLKGKSTHLGYFNNKEDAGIAYENAAKTEYREFYRT